MTSSISSWMRGAMIGAGVAFAVASAPGVAMATDINGSAAVGSSSATITGTDLSNVTAITPHDNGSPDQISLDGSTTPTYLGNPNNFITFSGQAASGGDITMSTLASGGGFTFTGTVGGETLTFTASTGEIISQSSSFLDLYFTGTTSFTGYTDTAGSARISLTNTGGSYSYSGTFASPPFAPPSVPEPASLALLGTGLLGLAMLRGRRA